MSRSKTAQIDIPSYQTGQALLEAEAGRMFLHLEDKSYVEVAYLFGLDRYYSSEASMRSAMTRAVNLVLDNPNKYELPAEKVAYIQGKLSQRSINPVTRGEKTLREVNEEEEKDPGKNILAARDLSIKLIKKRLQYLDTHPKALAEESLVSLVKAVSALFDKGQIVQGAATEHIAVMSNIPDKLDPEDAMKAIMQLREEINLQKQ